MSILDIRLLELFMAISLRVLVHVWSILRIVLLIRLRCYLRVRASTKSRTIEGLAKRFILLMRGSKI